MSAKSSASPSPSRARAKSLRKPAAVAAVPASVVPAVGESISLPLAALELSPRNVRKVAPTNVEELAALIAAQGLLQPLVVTAVDGAPEPRFAVEAGGRRLRALQILAERGIIAPDAPVDCRLVAHERAAEVSLAENSGRQAMHPADQCEAFKVLVDAGLSAEKIAERFGVTVRTVQQRLRLANVAPEIVTLFRKGEVTLDQMQALAISDDPARQLAVWNGLAQWQRQPWTLRERLLATDVPASDDRVRFVGLSAYEAAGGIVRRDLFSAGDAVFVTDEALLDQLVLQRLDQAAQTVRAEGWAWVEIRTRFGYAERAEYRSLTPSTETPSGEAAETIAKLRRSLVDVEATIANADEETEDGDTVEALERDARRLRHEIEAAEAAACTWTDVDRANSGAVISLPHGRLTVLRGLVARDDAGSTGEGGGAPADAEARPRERAEYSERLMLSLTSHRTAAIQASLIDAPNIALALLAQRLVLEIFTSCPPSTKLRVHVTTCDFQLGKNAPDLAVSRAGKVISTARKRWAEVLPLQPDTLLRWLLGLPQQALVDLLAFCVSQGFDATAGTQRLRDADGTEVLAEALSLDMADWWEATDANFFEAVPKAKIAEAVAEAVGTDAILGLAAMKKDAAAAAAAVQIAGKRWLPGPLRRVSVG